MFKILNKILFIGSGKTFTMNGSEVEPGIIPRTIDFVVRQMKKGAIDIIYSAALSMFEIYNGNLLDLLDSTNKPRVAPNGSGIENLTSVDAYSNENILNVWSKSIKNRKTASTIGNSCSSRSHAITQLQLTSENAARNSKTSAIINLVDLAGSESAKDTENMTETIAINSSLSALTSVVLGLKKKTPVIDYNQCLLTKVLKPSLSDKSKTLLITNLKTADINASINTLRFAAAMNNVKN